MGLGSTAKKLQKVADTAEDLYSRLNEVRDQVREMQNTVGETRDRVDRLEAESAEQRAILEALAEERGIDLDAVTAEVRAGRTDDAETDVAETAPGSGSGSDFGDGGASGATDGGATGEE